MFCKNFRNIFENSVYLFIFLSIIQIGKSYTIVKKEIKVLFKNVSQIQISQKNNRVYSHQKSIQAIGTFKLCIIKFIKQSSNRK